MIRYALRCIAEHAFESWFRDSASYESQEKAGLLACPHCGSAEVTRQIMAPSVAIRDGGTERQPVAMMGEKDAETRKKLRAFHAYLAANAENLGANFAQEARRIHYGEADERAIYGVATLPEAEALADEGIPVLPVPGLPDEMN